MNEWDYESAIAATHTLAPSWRNRNPSPSLSSSSSPQPQRVSKSSVVVEAPYFTRGSHYLSTDNRPKREVSLTNPPTATPSCPAAPVQPQGAYEPLRATHSSIAPTSPLLALLPCSSTLSTATQIRLNTPLNNRQRTAAEQQLPLPKCTLHKLQFVLLSQQFRSFQFIALFWLFLSLSSFPNNNHQIISIHRITSFLPSCRLFPHFTIVSIQPTTLTTQPNFSYRLLRQQLIVICRWECSFVPTNWINTQ